ncbi:MAG: thymidine phosphorylase [Spirochaetales bacterium]
MRAADLIVKKRNGESHSREEIEFLVNGYVDGSIPDYQISAWLMAVYFSGMTGEEAGALTKSMIESGSTMDLRELPGPLVDKHSTGGVGDKVSLILAPAAAACGLQVPMMSGRALGHTGGTLDKLESITGYSTQMDVATFRRIISECGYAMTGQSADIVPADRLLYALRDVTGTVESVPLITASIMSKKFAEGAESLVFDVKTGSGAFMKSVDASRTLAQSLIDTGKSLGRGTVAVITRMQEPLGYMVGNFLEVEESVSCLMGDSAPAGVAYPEDLMTVTRRLVAWMLVAGGVAESVEEGEERFQTAIDDGSAYERFRRNVELQGGDPDRLERELGERRGTVAREVKATRDGVVSEIDAYSIGAAGIGLGVGRSTTEDDVLPNVGVNLAKKVGDRVRAGERLCTVYGEDEDATNEAVRAVENAFTVGDREPERTPLIVDELAAL